MNTSTLDAIYRKYHKNIYNYIAFRINNHYDVEELTHTVFEKAITNWERYNPAKPVEPWLITIAKNTVTDYLRKNARRKHQGLDDVMDFPSSDKSPDEILLLDEENRDLMVAMDRLKPKERQILSLRFATDLKYDEIARIMGKTSANVRIITHRALKKLRAELEAQNL
ncbi:MAG: sigma-70 family RNA polymerase sigma factor [Defluviitaleaceae bacterium]|nr:sigma-70 family RNA polymerase sigma factor [Defluviitaleaceae bacterium]